MGRQAVDDATRVDRRLVTPCRSEVPVRHHGWSVSDLV